jgi:hypothetical protein
MLLNPRHVAATLAQLFEAATIENMKYIKKDNDKYMEMFGLIHSCVTDKGMDLVTADE